MKILRIALFFLASGILFVSALSAQVDYVITFYDCCYQANCEVGTETHYCNSFVEVSGNPYAGRYLAYEYLNCTSASQERECYILDDSGTRFIWGPDATCSCVIKWPNLKRTPARGLQAKRNAPHSDSDNHSDLLIALINNNVTPRFLTTSYAVEILTAPSPDRPTIVLRNRM